MVDSQLHAGDVTADKSQKAFLVLTEKTLTGVYTGGRVSSLCRGELAEVLSLILP